MGKSARTLVRTLSITGAGLLIVVVAVLRLWQGRDNARWKPMDRQEVDILQVSGVHANETCAPLVARQVYHRLQALGAQVALFAIPQSYTCLALLDDPAAAKTDYSQPAGEHHVDMDLDALDDELKRQFPRAVIFEFHNAKETEPFLGIRPGKPVADYEVGIVGPEFVRPYEVGTWRNVDREGRPGKCLIELPACYAPVDQGRKAARESRVAELRAQGYEFDPRWMPYLAAETDVQASRQKGYLDDTLAFKVADWILGAWKAGR